MAVLMIAALWTAGCSGGDSDPEPTTPAPSTQAPPLDQPPASPGLPPPSCRQPCAVPTADQGATEPSGAINPTDPDNFVVAAIEGEATGYLVPQAQGPGWAFITVRHSHDGGETWQRTVIPYATQAEPTSLWSRWCVTADPVVKFSPNGTAYLAGLGWPCSTAVAPSTTSVGAIWISRSDDGGRTWAEPVIVTESPGAVEWPDKEWFAIAPDGKTILMAWQGLARTQPSQILRYSVSRDGGETWSDPGVVTDSAEEDGPSVPSPAVAAAADGTFLIAYRGCTGQAACLKVARGTGDREWEIATVAEVSSVTRSGNQSLPFWMPSIAYDATSDGAYVAWHADGGAGDADVMLAWIAANGASAAGPIRLNDNPVGDGTDQFQPQLAVDASGRLHAFFYDRRDDPEHNAGTRPTYARYAPLEGVANAPAGPVWYPAGSFVHYGEYQAVDSFAGRTLVAWSQYADGGARVVHASVFEE